MKIRLERKILSELYILSRKESENVILKDEKFIATFMGSSVTAGKDHNINDSFPVVSDAILDESDTNNH